MMRTRQRQGSRNIEIDLSRSTAFSSPLNRLIKNSLLNYEKSGRLHLGRTERQTATSGLSVALVCTVMSGSAKIDFWDSGLDNNIKD